MYIATWSKAQSCSNFRTLSVQRLRTTSTNQCEPGLQLSKAGCTSGACDDACAFAGWRSSARLDNTSRNFLTTNPSDVRALCSVEEVTDSGRVLYIVVRGSGLASPSFSVSIVLLALLRLFQQPCQSRDLIPPSLHLGHHLPQHWNRPPPPVVANDNGARP